MFFYGYGDKFRREWMSALVAEPSRRLPEVDFALGGHDFRGDTGQRAADRRHPFPSFPRAISAARINLCLTRRPHATVYASSSCRPFELAAAGAAIVANPYNGIERWFEPGAELMIVYRRRRGDRGVPGPARRPCAGRGDGRVGPASACSTSTPIATARDACSSSSGLRCRRMSTEVESARREAVPRRGPACRGCGGSRSSLAYNEERNLGRLLDGATRARPGLEVVVVSDGSIDRTAEVAADRGAHVVRLPFNLGIGGAVQTGFRFAFGSGLRPRGAARRRRPA